MTVSHLELEAPVSIGYFDDLLYHGCLFLNQGEEFAMAHGSVAGIYAPD